VKYLGTLEQIKIEQVYNFASILIKKTLDIAKSNLMELVEMCEEKELYFLKFGVKQTLKIGEKTTTHIGCVPTKIKKNRKNNQEE
jgi:hypothetical protein